MKRVGFLSNVGVALLLSLLGGAGYAGLRLALGPATALQVVVAGLAGGYLLYLLMRAPERTGRVVAFSAWLAGTAAALMFSPHLGVLLCAQVLMIWLLRSLYFHSSAFAALADLLLSALAVGAGIWAAEQSGSLFMTAWCFFLVQALFVCIPAKFPRSQEDRDASAPDTFMHAHRAAESAVRRLVNQR